MKLIAEPWDVGAGGYQVGNFPVLWTEWNGKYRDSIRGFWNGNFSFVLFLILNLFVCFVLLNTKLYTGKGVGLGELATRISGSSDLYSMDSGKYLFSSSPSRLFRIFSLPFLSFLRY